MQSLEGGLNKAQQGDDIHKLQDSSGIVTDKRKELQLYKGQVLTFSRHSRNVSWKFKRETESNQIYLLKI